MKAVIVSGYFNPIHVGHLDYLEAARELGHYLIVIVNNDAQVRLKGRVEFMPEEDRRRIVEALYMVDEAVLSIDIGRDVCDTLREVVSNCGNQFIFANGGDQTSETIPETAICEELGIEMVFGVGGEKTVSSSELIEAAR